MAEKKWNMASYPDMNALKEKVRVDMQESIWDMVVEQFQYIGEWCVRIARDPQRANTWGDITGNLRSSIGYVIQVNGKPIMHSNIDTYPGKDGKMANKGPKDAKKLMKSLQGIHASGIELIVVAGMEYAEYVEVIHHRDVLATAKLEGEQIAKRLLGRLFSKVKGKQVYK